LVRAYPTFLLRKQPAATAIEGEASTQGTVPGADGLVCPEQATQKERDSPMSTNTIKKARVNEVDALQKLADGLTQHASTAPSVVLAGATLKPSDVVAKLQARIAQAKAVSSAAANWHSTVQTDHTAAAQLKPLLSAVKQVLLAAYSTQLDVLADFGLSSRKKPVVSPATKTAAALKAKATRAARGTKGTQQKAAITTQVTIAPATTTAVKVEGAGANPVAVPSAPVPAAPGAPGSAATSPPTAAPTSTVGSSPAPATTPAPAAHSIS
jgi:hypothetical protein